MSLTDTHPDRVPEPQAGVQTSTGTETVPSYRDLMWPVLVALRDLNMPASADEIMRHVVKQLRLSKEAQTEEIPSGGKTKLLTRFQHAAYQLKLHGLVRLQGGKRQLTSEGRRINEQKVLGLRILKNPRDASKLEADDLHSRVGLPKEKGYPAEIHTEDLTKLSDELLIDTKFLEDIVSLLNDKGQIILYGPPGTGKTYVALKLAQALAPDESCRALVQFHPSTSYEDFFEGYRPAGTDDKGGIQYELTPGPLARIAEEAANRDKLPHVMIIDEINRGNLPRVLGELLFLLEYRKNERVHTLYRPDDKFSLPKNLYFIGTMNTADRSIALVDAALRRRFHFIPFFPDRKPIVNLLRDWLEHKGQPIWVGDLVDAVNDELKRELDGSHLLLGPSHFMKNYGSTIEEQQERFRRVWEYNIEPFLEDQFFGNSSQTKHFRFDSVITRHRSILARYTALTNNDPLTDPPDNDTSDDPGLSDGHGSSSDDREYWMTRAQSFPPAGRRGTESYHGEMKQVVKRYVEFALNRETDPGDQNDGLVEEFLSTHEYSSSTRRAYRHHIREWFDTHYSRTT